MPRWPLTALILLASTFPAGCGGGPAPPPMGLHGGMLVPLAGEVGSVEVLRESVPGQVGQRKVLLYFLDPSNRLMSPGPTGVTLKLRGGRNAKLVEFQPAGASDPERAGAFTCPPLANALELIGELSAKIGDKLVSARIQAR